MPIELILAYDELNSVIELFDEYSSTLGLDLSFQDYKSETESLPGEYAFPYGRLYVAKYDDEPAGCIALRPFAGNSCEMKRLFVKPQFRGKKIGKSLVEKIIADARLIGYARMVLDTIPELKTATVLYKKMGFYVIEPYRYNPIEGALFMQIDL